MDALILSCGTGGGHDSAAKAMIEVFQKNGDHAVMLNPYGIYSKRKEKLINRTYISIAQKHQPFFGFVYKIASKVSKLPGHSPVYAANRKSVRKMQGHLEQNKYDVIVCTHLFPAEILTKLKNKGVEVPQTVFIATDYTCYPFTEETDCDYYIIASPWQTGEYIDRGIDRNKIKPLGIPVQSAFTEKIAKADAKQALGLEIKSRYVLICGGSMGSGNFIEIIDAFLNNDITSLTPIVVCGSNEKLHKKLLCRYGNKIVLLGKTDKMPLLMRASDLYLTKPGGLSTTEAATVGIPLVHLPPIPGCESANAKFFSSMGMSIRMDKDARTMKQITGLADDTDYCRLMIHRQQSLVPQNAAQDIYRFITDLSEPTSINTTGSD